MFDSADDPIQSRNDAFTLDLKAARPQRVVVSDHDLHATTFLAKPTEATPPAVRAYRGVFDRRRNCWGMQAWKPEQALHTERLVLEPLSARHAPAFLAYNERNRKHLAQWEPLRDDGFYTLARQEAAIARCEADAQRDLCRRFVAFESGHEQIIANVNLWNIRRGNIHAAIIGYSVDERRQGRGYATEAAAAVVRYAFDVLNLHRLETSYQPENTPSGRVLRKLGFVVEGYARDYLLLGGAWSDAILVALINPSWREPG